MNGKARALSLKILTWILPTITMVIIHISPKAAIQSQILYLPFVIRSNCTTNVVINGDFEQDDYAWSISSTGTGWKLHDLIGSVSEGFSPYRGTYAARLGGYEGVWDSIAQTITIPPDGRLTYWWKMGTYENLPHHDYFAVNLIQPDGTGVALLASHDDQDIQGIWQQDMVDLSAYAGGSYTLQFLSTNDNYYFSWFDLDEIQICS